VLAVPLCETGLTVFGDVDRIPVADNGSGLTEVRPYIRTSQPLNLSTRSYWLLFPFSWLYLNLNWQLELLSAAGVSRG